MIPFRVQIKYYLDNPVGLKVENFTLVFQRWIRKKSLEGQLVDVADYRHVYQGPGIVLIGHDSDYSIDNSDGHIGLLYTRKRQTDADLAQQLRDSFRLALTACGLIEAESAFKPKLKFRTDAVEIRFPDRLQLPNRPETFTLVQDDLKAVLADVYAGVSINLTPRDQDSRALFTIDVRAEGAGNVAALVSHLQKSGAAQA